MVCEWGMSEALGPLTYGQKEEQIFLGKEMSRHRDYSEKTAIAIDSEVSRLVTEHYEKAHKIIEDDKEAMGRIADALLERETLNAVEIEALIEGRELPPLEHTPARREERPPVESSLLDDGKVVIGRPTSPKPEKV
jgi:cell division protease FtsH